MAYGTVKVDNITFDNGGSDQNVTVSGLYRATTSGVTVTGTISGAVLVGTTTVSGATVTGNVVQGTTVQGVSGTFTSLTGTTTTGTTANFASGVFTTRVSGTIITGDTGQFTSGTFVSLTGTTITGTTINAVTVSSTTGTFTSLTGTTITGTTINGVTVAATTGSFTSLTGTTTSGTTANFVSGVFTTQVSGTTVTGTTSNFTSGNFATLSGATATFTSGIIASGTAAAPSLAILGDPDTGVFSPGADQLAVATNGTGRLFVDASGNVSIGTSAPGALLNLQGTFGTSLTTGLRIDGKGITTDYVSPIAFYIQSSGWGTQHSANIACGALSGTNGGGYLRFSTSPDGNTAPAERLRITATGLVGIGTTSPSKKLEIANGDVRLADGYTISWGDDTYRIFRNGSQLRFDTNGSQALAIDSSGRLLVGTSTARAITYVTPGVQVESTDYNNASQSLINNSSTDSNPEFLFGKTGSSTLGSTALVTNGHTLGAIGFAGADGSAMVRAANIAALVDGTPGANDMPGRLVFSTTADGASSPTERLRITSAGVLQIADAGNITVGTTTGTKIGTATTQKLGFYNATPVVQPTAVADATDAATVITQLNDLLAKLRTLGIIAT
jgi:hypothetical protein